MWFWRKKVLKPGVCECGHLRSSHVGGSKRCKINLEYRCACDIYIPATPEVGPDLEVEQLRKMTGLK
jgi:hypothetical protein